MGIDKDCIVDIHSLGGEYLCQVCEKLVYPNETLQLQCTHLYCRICFVDVVITTKVCPSDGYLVTVQDSKPLVVSDKALAERLDRTLVRCSYHRSGCSWQGPFSQCKSHCFGCSFRNYLMVLSPRAQTSSQLVAQASQAIVSQAATAPPSAHNASTSAAWPTVEQWSPQQLQEYAEQYLQSAQQLHQHAPLVGGQPRVYAQNSASSSTQPHYQLMQQLQCQSQEKTLPQTMVENNINERLMKLAEARKKERHQLHQQILDLQKKRDDIQLLELEIEELSGTLDLLRALDDDDGVEAKKKIESLEENLKDKDETIDHLECLNQVLLIKERRSNDELQDARKELINFVLEGPQYMAGIGVKTMGDIDHNTIISSARKIYPEDEVLDKTEEFYKQFVAKITNANWYPFKLTMAGENHQVLQQVIDEDDEYLRGIKTEWDNELYDAVLTAVTEMDEYNPSGRYFVEELWNYQEGRKASIAEGVKAIGDFLVLENFQ